MKVTLSAQEKLKGINYSTVMDRGQFFNTQNQTPAP